MEESVQFLGIRFTEEEIYEINKVLNSKDCNLHKLSETIMMSKYEKNKDNKLIYEFTLVFKFSPSTPYSIKITEEDLYVQIELLNKDIKKSNFSNKKGVY